MSSSLVNNRFEAQGMTGSFWDSNLTPESRRFVRSLTHLLTQFSLVSRMDLAGKQLTGVLSGDTGPTSLKFSASSVGVIGPDLQQRIISQHQGSDGVSVLIYRKPEVYDLGWDHAFFLNVGIGEALADDCSYFIFPDPDAAVSLTLNPNDLRPLYAVPVAEDFTPYAIRSMAGRELTLGTDYHMGHGAIVFRENPMDLFPYSVMVFPNGSKRLTNLLNYTLRCDEFSGDAGVIASYLREKASPVRLKTAAATAAGLCVILEESVVLQRLDRCIGSRYVLDTGVFDALYRHDRLPVGAIIPKDTVIGGGIEVYAGAEYRRLDWSTGLPAGFMCPVPGVVIPDRPCRAEAYATNGSKLHVRMQLGLPEQIQSRLWQHIRTSEEVTGFYLNDAIGLAAEGDFVVLNPLDFYFEHLLKAQGLIVEIRLKDVGEQFRLRAVNFFNNEKLVNAVLILRDL